MKRQPETTLPEVIRYRLDVVFAAAAMTILAGLIAPVPLRGLDIAWICSVCLAAAVILVCVVAKSCHDLQGFGALLGVLSLLRIGLIAMTVRKILQEQTAGVVVDILGKAFSHTGVITAGILGVLLVVICGWMVFLAAYQIRRSVRSYSDEVLPIKRVGLQADLSLHTISREQARTTLEKIRAEMRFFGSMGAISVLMRCETLAGMVMIIVALGIKATTDMMAAGFNPELMENLATQTAGLAVIAAIPAVGSGWSCVWLLGKSNLCLNSIPQTETEQGNDIIRGEITSSLSGDAELLNPDFVQKSQEVENRKEKIVDFEPEKEKEPIVQHPIQPLDCSSPEAYYRQLARIAAELPLAPGQAILLSCLPEVSLGVQAAVNTAISLAGRGMRTLLIDAEPQRSAVAKVFDLNRAATMISPHKTLIENLYVFTAGDTDTQSVRRTISATEQLHQKFGKIVVYGPGMAKLFVEKWGTRLHLILFVRPEQNNGNANIPEALTHCASLTVIPIL
jgi:hypothetical protein